MGGEFQTSSGVPITDESVSSTPKKPKVVRDRGYRKPTARRPVDLKSCEWCGKPATTIDKDGDDSCADCKSEIAAKRARKRRLLASAIGTTVETSRAIDEAIGTDADET